MSQHITHQWEPHPNQRSCGCVFQRCGICGVIRRTYRCTLHTNQAFAYDEDAYYTRPEMGNFAGMIASQDIQCRELERASQFIGPLWRAGAAVLDVGAGIGRLAPYVLATDAHYHACEIHPWAVRFMRSVYWRAITVLDAPFEELDRGTEWDAVLCVHTLEHFAESHRQFERMTEMIGDSGVIVTCTPNQADIWNPDHHWAFAPRTLQVWAAACGLRAVLMWMTEPMARGERYIWTSIRR